MTRIGVLNNLRAGKRGSKVPEVVDFLRGHPEIPHVETSDAGAVPEALRYLAEQDVELLVLNGGDGTVQRALTELLGDAVFERVPPIAPLRGGRTNMIALDLGARRSPARALHSLVEAARRGELERRMVDRRVVRLDLAAQGEVHYGMFFGAGAIHRAIDLVHRVFPSGRSQGVFGSGVVTAVLLARTAALHDRGGILTPDKIQLLLDGEPIAPAEYYVAFASTLGRLFLRMRPFWGRGPGPLRFTALASDVESMLTALPGILRGRPGPRVTPERGYVSRNVRHAELLLSCGFTLDGEQFPAGDGRTVRIDADTSVRFVRA